MKHSVLKNQELTSPLQKNTILKPEKKKNPTKAIASVSLTSLVDAFSILVIYLLVNTSTTNHKIQNEGIQLPQAQKVLEIQDTLIVQIKDSKIFINNKAINKNKLVRQIQKQAKNKTILIQADKDYPYAVVNPLVIASSSAGIERIHFAVEKK